MAGDERLFAHCSKSLSDHNAAFRVCLDLFLFENELNPGTKFSDLPPCAQSYIRERAAIGPEPIN